MKNYIFWFAKPSKIEIWRGLEAVFVESGGVLGSLGASWGRFGRALDASWCARGHLGGVLGHLGHLGNVLGTKMTPTWCFSSRVGR